MLMRTFERLRLEGVPKDSIAAVVTDNGSNCKKARNELPKQQGFSHIVPFQLRMRDPADFQPELASVVCHAEVENGLCITRFMHRFGFPSCMCRAKQQYSRKMPFLQLFLPRCQLVHGGHLEAPHAEVPVHKAHISDYLFP